MCDAAVSSKNVKSRRPGPILKYRSGEDVLRFVMHFACQGN